jgi:hypothetical protein
VGATTVSAKTNTALIGGFVGQCGVCVSSWRSPDGRTRTSPGAASGDPLGFVGPAGRWSWTWTGAALGGNVTGGAVQYSGPQAVVAAYLPLSGWRQYLSDFG